MKTATILTSFVITGFLATSAAHAATQRSAEELYSGLSAAAIQQVHQAADKQAIAHKSTCKWHEAKAEAEGKDLDPLYAAYPGEGYHEHEKDYLSPANMTIAC